MKFRKSWIILIILLLIATATAFYPTPEHQPIRFIERASSLIKTEKVAGEKWLVWLYNNPVGEATMWALVKRKFVSSFYGGMMDKPSSAEKIDDFVKDFNIDLSEAQQQDFKTFNDFFTRELIPGARPIDTNSNVIVAPADGKVMAWSDISNTDFLVKGYRFNIWSFLNDSTLASNYKDGSLLIFRLAPNDYHRFHFPINGNITNSVKIDGDYYSVNPIALREMVEIFCLNKREYTIIQNSGLGNAIITEVGATMVGSIIQTYTDNDVQKGEEKGYFKFGGSTVVLLFEKDQIQIDHDLLENTKNGFETFVKMGERIGLIR